MIGVFVAQGGEQYMVIGNFLPYQETDTIHFDNWSLNYSYHYIDDVSVKLCNGAGLDEINLKGDILVFPNPTNNYLNISCKSLNIGEIVILNCLGYATPQISDSKLR